MFRSLRHPTGTAGRARTAFLLGLVLGMLLFPAAAGLPYGRTWSTVQDRAVSGLRGLYEVAEPVATSVWGRVRAAFRRVDGKVNPIGRALKDGAIPYGAADAQ